MVFFVMYRLVMGAALVYRLVMYRLVMYRLVMYCLVMYRLVMYRFVMYGFVVHSLMVFTGFGLSRVARMPVIDRVVLVPVITSLLLMRALTICCLDTPIVCSRLFRGSRSRVDSTVAIEADVIISPIVDHCAVTVRIVYNRRIHVPNRGIIVKGTALPPTTIETGSVITEAIVHAAVESNVGTPIAAVPAIVAVRKPPVTRSPKVPRLGRFNPDAGNPEITVISVRPVAGTPIISVLRTRWLLVDSERGRGNCNRDGLSEKRGRYAQQTCE